MKAAVYHGSDWEFGDFGEGRYGEGQIPPMDKGEKRIPSIV
jgi:hypothetical protein